MTIKTGTKPPAKAATKTVTPWGPATLIEEVKVPQRAGEKRFASSVQLLENERGEPLVRIAYTTGGVGPARPGHAASPGTSSGCAPLSRSIRRLARALGLGGEA